VGKPIISCSIGTSSYHELCDIGASISIIPSTLYLEIKADIDPIEMEETGMTIQLSNKEYISPLGVVRDVGVLVGKIKYPADFIVLGCSQDSFCPFLLLVWLEMLECLLERLNILLILLCLVAPKIHFVLLYLVDHFCTLLELELICVKKEFI
jgi:hypothetical protein